MWRLDGSPTGEEVVLSGDVFDAPIRPDLVHRCVVWQLAKRRQGTHAAKDRGQVSGTGRKPWPQKGTGRARAGSKRAPQFRGGGAVHAPRPRSHATGLPRKVRQLALRCALSAKLAEGQLVVVDDADAPDGRTAALARQLCSLQAARGLPSDEPGLTLICHGAAAAAAAGGGGPLRRAAANLRRVHLLPAAGLNVYSVLQLKTLVLTRAAVDEVTQRLEARIKR